MEEKEFEKSLRNLFQEDPIVPDQLKWENMDIELPEKRSSRRGCYFSLALLWSIGIAILLVGLLGLPNSSESISDRMEEGTNSVENLNPKTFAKDPDQNIEKCSTAQVEDQINPTRDTDVPTSLVKKSLSVSNKLVNGANSNTSLPSMTEVSLLTSAAYLKSLEAPSAARIASSEWAQLPASQPVSIANLSSSPISLPQLEEITLLPESAERGENNRFFLGVGLNRFSVQSVENSSLMGNVSTALGRTFAAGFQISWTSKLAFLAQVNYDQYHSVFEHARPLDTLIDASNSLRTIRTELTYHNNYSYTLGLRFGLRRQIHISSLLQLYLGGGLEGLYLMEATGKTTDGPFTAPLFLEDGIPKASFGASLEAGFVIPINERIHLETSYNLRQMLINPVYINRGLRSNRQHTLFLGLSYSIGQF